MANPIPAPLSRRDRAASWSARVGFTQLLEAVPKRPLLLVLTYHRVGDPDVTPYDPGTFSATAEQFDQQIGWLKRRFRIVSLDEAIDTLERGLPLRQMQALITFDDGYLDNYREAFPVLRSHGVSGTFFLPTSFIGTAHVPWWDAIAYIVKTSRQRRIRLTYPKESTFDLDKQGLKSAILHVLFVLVSAENTDNELFISKLEEACESCRPQEPSAERCFLNWQEAGEMLRGGMTFGSHTHSHEVLSNLSAADQREELIRSQGILKSALGVSISVLAYPVGQRHSFNQETIDATRSSGYRAAFSSYGGLNYPGQTEMLNIQRSCVYRQSLPLLRAQIAWGSLSGRGWT